MRPAIIYRERFSITFIQSFVIHWSVSPTSVSVSVSVSRLCFYMDYDKIYGITKKFAGLRRNLWHYEEFCMNICLFLFFPHFKSFLGLIIYSFYEKEVTQIIFCKNIYFKKKLKTEYLFIFVFLHF